MQVREGGQMKQLRIRTILGRASRIALPVLLAVLASTAFGQAPPTAAVSEARPAARAAETRSLTQSGPGNQSGCDVSGKDAIRIECDYTEAPAAGRPGGEPRIVLKHSLISFETDDENYMRVELTFTNQGQTPVSEPRSVYLAIDDDSGRNYFRRALPGADLRKLTPGKHLMFSERLLVPVLLQGRYVVHLWIPSSDPALQFNPAQNLLLSNQGVAKPDTGLNQLATFSIVP